MKQRLDKLLVARGLVPSRERAAGMILAGRVLVDDQKVTKAGSAVHEGAVLRLLGEDLRYVSRGGLKLEGARAHWEIDLRGRGCADIGASTGGFIDCMLQRGASAVLAVDTGYGQLAMSLRTDPRVRLLERTNARHLGRGVLLTEARHLTGEVGPDFFSMDVSFISAALVIPSVVHALAEAQQRWTGECIILVKPQFEAGREWVGKGGIVRDPVAYDIAVEKVHKAVTESGGSCIEVIDSPITGAEGNREFLMHAVFS